MRRSSTKIATYSYYVLHVDFPIQTHRSALHGVKSIYSIMSWILCAHLSRELFRPYSALKMMSV